VRKETLGAGVGIQKTSKAFSEEFAAENAKEFYDNKESG
jgi:hypothetical protein